jgi:aerotaxis receptor
MVRHPDMPEEAFADLWRTLQAGRPWTGLVKNRRKNGDHYWVVANATPLLEAAGQSATCRCAPAHARAGRRGRGRPTAASPRAGQGLAIEEGQRRASTGGWRR